MSNYTESNYTNPGFGLVLENHSTADRVQNMFAEKSVWTSRELNDKVGWQFSQAIYTLRRKGFNIVTRHLGGRQYAYELV